RLFNRLIPLLRIEKCTKAFGSHAAEQGRRRQAELSPCNHVCNLRTIRMGWSGVPRANPMPAAHTAISGEFDAACGHRLATAGQGVTVSILGWGRPPRKARRVSRKDAKHAKCRKEFLALLCVLGAFARNSFNNTRTSRIVMARPPGPAYESEVRTRRMADGSSGARQA